MTGWINTHLCYWMMLEELRRRWSQESPTIPIQGAFELKLQKSIGNPSLVRPWIPGRSDFCVVLVFPASCQIFSYLMTKDRVCSPWVLFLPFASCTVNWLKWLLCDGNGRDTVTSFSETWLLMMESLYEGRKCLPFDLWIKTEKA